MSTIKVNSIKNTSTNDGGIAIDNSGHVQIDGQQLPTAGALSHRNLVINGGMTVWQRGTASAAVTNGFLADRFIAIESTDGAITHEQSTDAPDGFAYSLKLNVTTADTSLAAGQFTELDHRIEAQNLYHLKYGSNAAETVTLSFWVKSSKTGTYCIRFDKTDATRYNYVKEYTISSANTWEKKTITIEPDSNIKASGGAIANDNGIGLQIIWSLAMGSTYSGATDGVWSSNNDHFATSNQVNWMDSTSNNFYLTGVQLEVGAKSTEFEHRSYGDELAKCQRYYAQSYTYGTTAGTATSNGAVMSAAYAQIAYASAGTATFPVTMRAAPSVTIYGTGGTAGKVNGDSTEGDGSLFGVSDKSVFIFRNNDNSGVAVNVFMRAHYTASAEL